MWLYSIGLCVALVAALPFWLLQMATRGKYRAGLPERFGRVPARLVCATPSIWIHAVSVGEVIAVLPLAARLAKAHPHLSVLLSTTTQTGQQLARERWGAERVFYFPLDFRWIVRKYLRTLRPALIVLAETELWPNFIFTAEQQRVPIAVVNARISDRSYPRYRRLRWFWKPHLKRIAHYCAQSAEDARRLSEIGAPADRVHITSNLKFDVPAPANSPFVDQIKPLLSETKVLVAGSTLDAEEKLLLDAWPALLQSFPGLFMILAPRHPERFSAVASMLASSAIPYARRSEWTGETSAFLPGRVFLLDTIGELASTYSLASVAFVGGSAFRGGGHNPLEPAQWGVPVVMGPSHENFRGIVNMLRSADAIRIAQPEKLVAELQSLLADDQAARAMGQRALAVAKEQTGALQRTTEALNQLLAEHTQ